MEMDAKPAWGAARSAHALLQHEDPEGDQRPYADGHQQDEEQTDIEPWAGALIHRTSTLLLLVGIAAAQLAWVAVLAYGALLVWRRLAI